MNARLPLRWLVWLLALVLAVPAPAHDPGVSMAEGRIAGDTLVLEIGFAPADVQQLLPADQRPTGGWTPELFKTLEPHLLWLAPQLYEVTADGTKLKPAEVRTQLLAGDNISFRLLYIRPPGARKMTLRAVKLDTLPPGHREFVAIADSNGFASAKKLLSARDDVLELDLTQRSGNGTTNAGVGAGAGGNSGTSSQASTTMFYAFLWLGIRHIWTGYDHLLFLFALLVVCGSFRSIVAILSCFTLAHSLTLALATLNIVNLPARITDPAIAASIVFVGVENLVRRGAEPRGRWALTFLFGLIHGFGFATVLRDLGVGEGGTSLALPLFSFNLGVEFGQIAIAAIVLPVIWQLRKSEAFLRRGVPVLSALVALAGLYWLLERTVFA